MTNTIPATYPLWAVTSGGYGLVIGWEPPDDPDDAYRPIVHSNDWAAAIVLDEEYTLHTDRADAEADDARRHGPGTGCKCGCAKAEDVAS